MSVKFENLGAQQATISVKDIKEGERFREDYGDLEELKSSIKGNGLITPIAVHRVSDNSYVLVAGGRRLRACTDLGMEEIPCRVYDNLTELELRLVELAENLHRKEMTWWETTKLQREIHTLRQKQHGVALGGPTAAGGNAGWRQADTAELLGVSKSAISTAIAVQDAMEKHPQFNWDSCATMADAIKLKNKIDESSARAELIKRATEKTGSNLSNLRAKLLDNYVVSDVFEGLAKQADEMFDFAEIDPPYAIDLHKVKMHGDTSNYVEVEDYEYLIFMRKVLEETYRVLKPNTFAVLWFGLDPWLESLYQLAKEIGFNLTRTPGIWVKPNGQSMNPNSSLASSYETFLILRKGTPLLAKPGRVNTFIYSPVPAPQKTHPTQRPMELITDVLKTFTFENASIISPFLGSGTTIAAAALEKRTAMGFDLSPEYKNGFARIVSETFIDKD